MQQCAFYQNLAQNLRTELDSLSEIQSESFQLKKEVGEMKDQNLDLK